MIFLKVSFSSGNIQSMGQLMRIWHLGHTVKPVLSGHSKEHQKLVFNTNYRLMQVESIAECSNPSILQYFRPSLSYHFPLRPLFCLFLSGHL